MLLALGGSSITEHDGLTVVATPRTSDFWGGNFVLAPSASALVAAVARHAEMFPEADFVSVGIDGTDGALGIDAAAAGRGLTVERSTALSSTAVCPTVGVARYPAGGTSRARARSAPSVR